MAFPNGAEGPEPGSSDPILIEDLPGLTGQVFEGASLQVSREERDTFERITHIGDAYPQGDAPEFPEDIVEGFHTLSLLDAMFNLVRPFDPDTTWGLNYGLDRVRFIEPVKPGVTLRSRFEFREVKEKGEGWLVLVHAELTAEGAEAPALVAEWWIYVMPRKR